MQPRIHDRKAERPTPGDFAPAIMDDPFEVGAKIVVLRRLDVLSRMHSRGQLKTRKNEDGEALFLAGRKYQELCAETAIGSVGTVDPSVEYVDGGAPREMLTDRKLRAFKELHRVDLFLVREFGVTGKSLVRAVLEDGRSLTQIAALMGYSTDPRGLDIRSLSWLFSKCLNQIAVDLGYMD
jgi:hypothetical protein